MTLKTLPEPTPQAGLAALQGLITRRSMLDSLLALHAEMGDVFRLNLPGFRPVVMAGPAAARWVLVEARQSLLWRNEGDPVAGLLRRGVLVQDGEDHLRLRKILSPGFQKAQILKSASRWADLVDWVTYAWREDQPVDMLVEMRKIALLILMDSLFAVDMSPELDRLFTSILKVLEYISPGLWMFWQKAPRPGYSHAIAEVDSYLYALVASRRRNPKGDDLLTQMVSNPALDDDLIRDQLLTLLIAGHDTSTALLAWTLYLLAQHPVIYQSLQAEVDAVLGSQPPPLDRLNELVFMGQVIDETLRLYPPIHTGNRRVACDLDFNGWRIPEGARLIYSIFLTHRDPKVWADPNRFNPYRFAPGSRPVPYSYLPFGGGPRNCLGAAFTDVEVKVVLGRVLQGFHLAPAGQGVRLYMGATLEPRPGVKVWVTKR